MSIHTIGNYAEAGLWGVVTFVLLVHGLRRGSFVRRSCLIAAATCLAFGVSDLVEVRTGAWWRPWWLLAWKAACVVVLVAIAILAWRRRGARGSE